MKELWTVVQKLPPKIEAARLGVHPGSSVGFALPPTIAYLRALT